MYSDREREGRRLAMMNNDSKDDIQGVYLMLVKREFNDICQQHILRAIELSYHTLTTLLGLPSLSLVIRFFGGTEHHYAYCTTRSLILLPRHQILQRDRTSQASHQAQLVALRHTPRSLSM